MPWPLFNADQAGLDSGENITRAWVVEVSGNLFDVLGIQPYLGRLIHLSLLKMLSCANAFEISNVQEVEK
jgi:hypothetical protein